MSISWEIRELVKCTGVTVSKMEKTPNGKGRDGISIYGNRNYRLMKMDTDPSHLKRERKNQ